MPRRRRAVCPCRILHVPRDPAQEVRERGCRASDEFAALHAAVDVDVGDRVLAQGFGVVHRPLRRAAQQRLLAIPDGENDRSAWPMSLLQCFAETTRRLEERRSAT